MSQYVNAVYGYHKPVYSLNRTKHTGALKYTLQDSFNVLLRLFIVLSYWVTKN